MAVSKAQLYLAMTISSALAFLGIVPSLTTLFITNSGMQRRLDPMQDSINLVHRDPKEFYANQAVHDVEIANLKMRAQ